MAHAYHTKVPHKAIMRYILHYTVPGDVVFDGFCGTGMTGVAAHLCGDRQEVTALGYRVGEKGVLYSETTDPSGKTRSVAVSRIGSRRAVLNDLSPAATFIAGNYATPIDARQFKLETDRLLEKFRSEPVAGCMRPLILTERLKAQN